MIKMKGRITVLILIEFCYWKIGQASKQLKTRTHKTRHSSATHNSDTDSSDHFQCIEFFGWWTHQFLFLFHFHPTNKAIQSECRMHFNMQITIKNRILWGIWFGRCENHFISSETLKCVELLWLIIQIEVFLLHQLYKCRLINIIWKMLPHLKLHMFHTHTKKYYQQKKITYAKLALRTLHRKKKRTNWTLMDSEKERKNNESLT